jgi:hypothetical protein
MATDKGSLPANGRYLLFKRASIQQAGEAVGGCLKLCFCHDAERLGAPE